MLVAPLQPWRGFAAAPSALPTVLIDDRHPEARAFGGVLAGRGAQVHAVPEGDVSALWRESIAGIGDLHRLFMLKLNQKTGAITMDTSFRDSDGKAGFNFDDRQWPGGWKGSANPHGVVFSR